jgi:hypothetical protein
MRRTGRGDDPADLPVHRWARAHEREEAADDGDETAWVRQLLERRERRERERAEPQEEDLPVELREFLSRRRAP